jgi:ribokinase
VKQAPNPENRVFGLGQCSLDYLVQVPDYPPPDAKCEFQTLEAQGGGPVATALVALSRWGVSTSLAGVIGDDDFGRRIRASLEEEQIELSGLRVREGSASQFAFVVAEPGRGTRTVFWRRPTGRPLDPDEIDTERLRRSEILYTDGLMIEAALAAARLASSAGIRVVVDAGTLRDGMLELALLSDAFVVSEKFAQQLTGGDDPEAACRELAALGPRLVGVTLGARGYVALEGGQVIRGVAHPVHAIDTTGCGDVFHAGIAFGLLEGWETRKCLDFAAWAASRVATRPGGRAGIPRYDGYPGRVRDPDSPSRG